MSPDPEPKRTSCNQVLYAQKIIPKLFIPGESQFENEAERETRPPGLADQSLTKIGILIRLLVLSPKEFQTVLVPWWTSYFSLHTIAVATVLRLKRVTSAIFCHNVYPHNAPSLEKALSRLVIRQFKKVFVQSRNEYDLVKSFHPKAKCAILSHPPYPSQRPPNTRHYKQSEGNGPIKVLFFGFIRD